MNLKNRLGVRGSIDWEVRGNDSTSATNAASATMADDKTSDTHCVSDVFYDSCCARCALHRHSAARGACVVVLSYFTPCAVTKHPAFP
jgi:hypothetical protein